MSPKALTKGSIMRSTTSSYPFEHRGIRRVAQGLSTLKASVSGTVLLTAVVGALMVVLNQLVDSWPEGHLLAAWALLWVVAFVGLVLLSSRVRRVLTVVRSGLRAWNDSRKQAAVDERTWKAALQDARLMADISRAMTAQANRKG
jgi:hypothetical protein